MSQVSEQRCYSADPRKDSREGIVSHHERRDDERSLLRTVGDECADPGHESNFRLGISGSALDVQRSR